MIQTERIESFGLIDIKEQGIRSKEQGFISLHNDFIALDTTFECKE